MLVAFVELIVAAWLVVSRNAVCEGLRLTEMEATLKKYAVKGWPQARGGVLFTNGADVGVVATLDADGV